MGTVRQRVAERRGSLCMRSWGRAPIVAGGPIANLPRVTTMTAAESERAPTRDGVIRAAGKVAAILPPTPLLACQIGGARCWAKAECLQPIGAFKIRGAWHRLS